MAKYHYKYVIQFEEDGCVKYFDLRGEVYSLNWAKKYDNLKEVKKELYRRGRNSFYKNFKILKYKVYEEEFIKEMDAKDVFKEGWEWE